MYLILIGVVTFQKKHPGNKNENSRTVEQP